MFHMALQVKVGTVCDAPKLAPAEWEFVFDIDSGIRVMGKLVLVMLAQTHIFFRQVQIQKPFFAEIAPVSVPFQIFARLAEEFKFHLFKLACTERKVAGSDFVAETLADLRNSERHF